MSFSKIYRQLRLLILCFPKKSELFLSFFFMNLTFFNPLFLIKKTLKCNKIQSNTAKILIFEEKKF